MSDDRLSTRDIASPQPDDEVVRDEPAGARETAPETAADVGAPTTGGPDAPGAAVGHDEPATTADTGASSATATADREAAEREAAGDRPTTSSNGGGSAVEDTAPLLSDSESFQRKWEEVQVRFVDEPRGAVEDADALVATVMQRLAESFAQERERLEAQWGRGEDISTEDLRVALQRYRSFFQRLLST
jgi:hypothetical protein